MTIYKYADSTNQVVMRIDDDGKCRMSLYVGDLTKPSHHQRQYLRWLDAGNKPDPADPDPIVERVPTADEKIQALTEALVSSGVIATRDVEVALSTEVIKR